MDERPQYRQRMDGQSSCTLCAALTRDRATHTKWHLQLAQALLARVLDANKKAYVEELTNPELQITTKEKMMSDEEIEKLAQHFSEWTDDMAPLRIEEYRQAARAWDREMRGV